ncbi:TetR/AcrR family transcriptional regulator [Streptomyces radicis]|uniref:TetR/AcrR family transcriptional regulator n=1 Tax=Streptomyces radicis TaxID=1750517 RepID=A0A3A9W6E6_9ACTN|nr:TetR/AcrR family transcriptional regulator [Streptomyces radicis]RKN08765.1 TetR/AcrR family transcriptional regulator [Streptomyces radicis]RKN21923.1 TetR/AcrR family transcriptional regulator [Streptomyces radicis]
MARVSQEHLEARRRQILQGAARCFARDGFHGTSMQDVFKETGLSAGAVYRYFPAKEAIIGALAHEVLDTVRGAFADALASSRLPHPDEILSDALRRVESVLRFPPPLVVQVWAESFRDERLAAVLRNVVSSLLDAWREVVNGYIERGLIPPGTDPEAVARVLTACAQGFMVQRALLGPLDHEMISAGVHGLTSFSAPESA